MALSLLIGLEACAAKRAREIQGAKYRVREVEIEGNETLSDKQIEPYLNVRETRWFPLPDRQYLNEGFVPVDAKRIEDLYAAKGHYDATVVEQKILSHDRDRLADVADVTFVVDENAPTKTTRIAFEWPEGPPSGPSQRRATREKVQTHCNLEIGAPFDTEEMHNSEATMKESLRARGYAFASVRAQARVDRVARTAQVVFEIIPGPWVKIGKVEIVGLDKVPERPVRVEFEDELGKPYSPDRIERIESAVYATNVFSSVVSTLAEAPRGEWVDLTLRVREGRPQSVQLGVTLGFEPNRWEQYGSVRYRHENLGGTLTSLELRLEVGYAELPAIYRPDEHGPIIKFEPTIRKKGLLEKHLVWTLEPTFELGIQQGYQFYSPTNRVGVSRFFSKFVEIGLSHNLTFVDFFNLSPTLEGNRTMLGLDFRDPYLLSYIELKPILRFTDDILDPKNGVVFETRYELAGGIFGGQFDYQTIIPEVRGYFTPLRKRLEFGIRAQVGFIVPFGDEPGAPFDRKLYLGGSNTIRGWGMRRLSPTLTSCPESECSEVPIGGNTSVLGNFETRVRLWQDLWGVGFVDMGDVQPGLAEFRPREWNYSAGPGLRYESPIGTFRLDFGVRLNNPAQYASQPRYALHFGLGEAF